MTPKRVAIIQPYFFPYLGYYSLFARADEVILLDCVQFPRRGRVHRSPMPSNGEPKWLTLPLARQPVTTTIRELRFSDTAPEEWEKRLARQDWYLPDATIAGLSLKDLLFIRTRSVADYLCAQIEVMCAYLGLDCPLSRSSALAIDPRLKAQDRIIEIATRSGATGYINPPGGRTLYQGAAFEEHGLQLHFLPPYDGPHLYLLPALMRTGQQALRADLDRFSNQPLLEAA
ncbi:WbqC family protein [Roseovarius aestuariivivens]|uniref:WbqC family protein n=1 Tax=Roseovarius aestuariivivens TaxID=1888910 RepID=UPI0014367D72|nr:WbqC family protein [Roseovarius aestuariivivens]